MSIFALLTAQTAVLDRVPAISIAALIISVGLIVAIPTVSILFIRKRCEMTFRSMMYGMLCYILTSYLVQQLVYTLVHMLIVNVFAMEGAVATAILAVIYNVTTVIIEVGGIYLCMILLKRYLPGIKNAVGVAIGYASLEIVMVMGMSVFVFAALILSLNTEGLDAIVASYPEGTDLESVRATFQSLIDTKWYEYLIYGIQSLCMAISRYCMIGILYGVSIGKMNKNGVLIATLFAMGFRIPDLLYQAGILNSSLAVEGVYVLMTVIIVIVTRQVVYMYLMDLVREIIQPKKKQQAKMPKIVMPK